MVPTMAEVRLDGACACGTRVVLIQNSHLPTCRSDGVRYIYPNRPDTGWCIFRCKVCKEVISETWRPSKGGAHV